MEMSTFFASAPSGTATEVPSPSEMIAPEDPTVADPPDFLQPADSTTSTAARDRLMSESPACNFTTRFGFTARGFSRTSRAVDPEQKLCQWIARPRTFAILSHPDARKT